MAKPDSLRGVHAIIQARLGRLQDRLVEEADAAATPTDLTSSVAAALIEALGMIPGARAVAADVVSTAMYRGLGDTFDAHTGELDAEPGTTEGGWLYTAVMDGATCDTCEAWDGQWFATWEEIAGPDGPLPDGGPNPDCEGNGRCRCRASIA